MYTKPIFWIINNQSLLDIDISYVIKTFYTLKVFWIKFLKLYITVAVNVKIFSLKKVCLATFRT